MKERMIFFYIAINKIETQNQAEIPFFSGIVPRDLSVIKDHIILWDTISMYGSYNNSAKGLFTYQGTVVSPSQ